MCSSESAIGPIPSIASHGEVNQVFSIRRQVAASLIDAAVEPLSDLKFVMPAIPEHRANLFGWPAPNDYTQSRLSCQETMDSRKEWSHKVVG
jgi:hypothetical protein